MQLADSNLFTCCIPFVRLSRRSKAHTSVSPELVISTATEQWRGACTVNGKARCRRMRPLSTPLKNRNDRPSRRTKEIVYGKRTSNRTAGPELECGPRNDGIGVAQPRSLRRCYRNVPHTDELALREHRTRPLACGNKKGSGLDRSPSGCQVLKS